MTPDPCRVPDRDRRRWHIGEYSPLSIPSRRSGSDVAPASFRPSAGSIDAGCGRYCREEVRRKPTRLGRSNMVGEVGERIPPPNPEAELAAVGKVEPAAVATGHHAGRSDQVALGGQRNRRVTPERRATPLGCAMTPPAVGRHATGQYEPRPLRSAGMVFARMYTSMVSDKFST
jgi:hypothetical protein